MLKIISFFIVFILVPAAFIIPQKKNNIKEPVNHLIGKWSTVVKKGERAKTIITFNSNGHVEYEIAAVIEGTYVLNRSVLITYFNNPKENATEVDTSFLKIKGDTLFQTNIHRNKKILIKSVKLDKKNKGGGIIGKWLSESFNGHKAIQEFGNDRSVLVDLIVRTIKGTYSVSGDNLTLDLELTPVIKSKFTIRKNEMTIEQIGKKEKTKLTRIDD